MVGGFHGFVADFLELVGRFLGLVGLFFGGKIRLQQLLQQATNR
ncbi:hypothetical protein ACOKXV_16295 [Sporosarcina psychrophila]